jgi:hypothetical protein
MDRIIYPFLVALLCWPSCAMAADLIGRASVIDGDTIEIHDHRIRLYGVDGMGLPRCGSHLAAVCTIVRCVGSGNWTKGQYGCRSNSSMPRGVQPLTDLRAAAARKPATTGRALSIGVRRRPPGRERGRRAGC